MKKYWVVGGEYASTDFDKLATKEEKFGPFESYEDAMKAWASKAWETVDNCNSRYEIVEG